MPQDWAQDIPAIRHWMQKEPHLPNELDELMLRKFLHSCYYSLEATKKCIDKFFSTRSIMTDAYTKRDPLSDEIQTAFSITNVCSYEAGDQEVLIYQLDDPGLEKMVFYDLVKAFSILGDFWLQDTQFLAEGHIIVFDIKDITLKIIPKLNIMFFRDYLIFLLEAMPVRVKQVHVVNCPSYVDKLYALVKPALPAEINELIKFHPTTEGLFKFIDKKAIPAEYGGEAQSMKKKMVEMVKRTETEGRAFFLNDDIWKADLNRKPKDKKMETHMNGSFRTLSID